MAPGSRAARDAQRHPAVIPDLDEGGRSRKKLTFFVPNMKSFQRLSTGKVLGNRSAFCRYVDEAKRPLAIVAAINPDLRAT